MLLLLLLLSTIIRLSQNPRHNFILPHRPNFSVICWDPAAYGRPILLMSAPTSALEQLAE
jgi:hypothetical protein